MEAGETMDFSRLQLFSTIFAVLLLTWLPHTTATDDPFECHEQGLCSQNLPGPGSLNMSDNENRTFQDFYGRPGAVWHCAENFTTFEWYKLINNTYVPFPWGRENGIELCDSNQTITIKSLQTRDEGTYMYKASNGTTDVWGFINYEVACKPGTVHLITKEQAEQYLPLGAKKTLHCAAYFGNCEFYDGVVMWHVQTSHGQQPLTKNTTSRFITCNTGGVNGQSCNLTFSKVSADDFGVKYICRLSTPEVNLNPDYQYSVVFIKLDIVKKSWLFIILGTALGCALICGVTVFILRHHGERIKFWLRWQPDRRYWKHDVALIHDEDHEHLIENYIKPQLMKEGYRICVMRPGCPAILEQTSGIVSAYSVIFSFSPHEIHGDSGILAELAANAKQKHSRHNIIVIRKDEEQGIDHSETSSAEQRQIQRSARCQIKNAWKDLKHLAWPRIEIDEESGQPLHSRQLDMFWSSLRKHLPRFETNQSVNMTEGSSQREIRTSCSSTNSRHHLLSSCSQESTHYSHDSEDLSPFTNGIKGNDFEEEIDYNQKLNLLQTTSLTYPINMPSKKRLREYQNISKNVLEEPCKQNEHEEEEDEKESTEDEQDEDVPAAVKDYRKSTPETVQVANPSVNQTLTPSPSSYSSFSPLGTQVILTRIPEDGTVTQSPDSSFPIFSDFHCLYSEPLSEESVASAQCHQDSILSSLENCLSSTGTGQGTSASQSVFKYIPTQLIDNATNAGPPSRAELGNTHKSITNARQTSWPLRPEPVC